MPDAETAEIRIYCICGQKMKVGPAMLGRNGKCVACRQKIRIPRADELPPGGRPVYLKEQTQFLRLSTPQPRGGGVDYSGVDGDEYDLGGEEATGQAVALEVLPVLQRLCNLEQKAQRHLELLSRGESRLAGQGHDKATLMRYRALARQARGALDEELRQRLVEIQEQLEEAGAELTREHVAFRLAETTLGTYQERVVALRQRRERLARRLQNVRGWLATNDPYAAGGHLDVTLEDVPTEAPEVTFSVEPTGDRPLAQLYVESLREALEGRDAAERRLAELRRMRDEGAVDADGESEVRLEAEAAVARARALVAFCRVRLEQCQQDADHDQGAVLAHLGVLRDRVARRQLDQSSFLKLEVGLLRAQEDARHLRDLARKAVSATEARDIPNMRPTLIDRLSRPASAPGIEADSWVAFAASVVMIVNIVAPFSSAELGGSRVVTLEAAVGLFVAAVLTTLAAFLGRREARGLAYCGLWVAGTLLGAYHVYECWYSLGDVGRAMRLDRDWFRSAGILMFGVSSLTLGSAAVLALHNQRRYRRYLGGAGLVVAMSVVFLYTDAGGFLRPGPALEPVVVSVEEGARGEAGVAVTVRNTGRRTFWIGGGAADSPAPYHFAFERQVDDGIWEEVAGRAPGGAVEARGAEARLDALVAPLVSDLRPMGPGEQWVAKERLPAGVYRARLVPRMRGLPEVQRSFEVAASASPFLPGPPGPREAVEAYPDPEGSAWEDPAVEGARGPSRSAPPVAAVAPQVEVTLRGILAPAGRAPGFVVSVRDMAGVVEQRRVALGETVVGAWVALEFNPDYKTLTLGNGERMVVLESGKPVLVVLGAP